MRTHQSSHRRALVVLILPLFVLGLFLGFGHSVAYQHELCPVDGEVAHVDDGHHHSDSSEAPDREHSDENEHEHCGLPTLGTSVDTPQPEFELGVAHLAVSVGLPTPQTELSATSEALYLLAPKNSPPCGC